MRRTKAIKKEVGLEQNVRIESTATGSNDRKINVLNPDIREQLLDSREEAEVDRKEMSQSL